MWYSASTARILWRYGLAVVAVAGATAVRWALHGVFSEGAQFITFYPAVALVAMFLGTGPGVLATLLSVLAADLWFFKPYGTIRIDSAGEAVGLGLFGLSGLVISGMAEMLNRWRQRAVEAERRRIEAEIERSRQLEELVHQRTGELESANARLQTERQELKRQKELLAVTLSSIGDGVIVTDAQGRVTFLNGEAERLTGWQSDEASGQSLPAIFKIINEESRQPVENPVDKVLRLGMVVGLANHTVLIAKDGRETPIDDSGAPIREADGTVHGVVLVFRDFSEQKTAERALRESEETLACQNEELQQQAEELERQQQSLWRESQLLNSVMMATDVMLVYLDPDFNFVWVNQAYAQTCKMRPEEMVGKNHFALYPHAENEAIFRRVRNTGEVVFYKDKAFEFPDQPERGVTYWDWSLTPVRDDSGKVAGLVFSLRETTKYKRAEIAVAESEQRYRGLFESMDEGFALCEMLYDEAGGPLDFRYLEVNPAFEKLTGLPVGSVVGRCVTEAIPGIERYWIESYDRVVRTGQGERFANHVAVLGREFEVYAYRPSPGRFAAIFIDITERKQAKEDLKAAKDSAEQAKATAERASAAKDHFLAVLSHELRTPLTPVVANVSMLQRQDGLDAATQEKLEVIRRNAELEARLIDDLLDVTRISRGKIELDRRPVELCSVIHQAAEVCLPDIEARHLDFGIDAPDGPYIVEADAARLQQVFWNLLKNAVKFTPHGGCVGIRCRHEEDTVVVEVSDSGAGIEPEVLPKLFNAFEQGGVGTTRQFGGLGLGLAISKGLVEMHGGLISAHSDGKGKGATFRVRLPLVNAEPETPRVAGGTPSGATARVRPLRVLVVEDHGDTARTMRLLLRSEGHAVELAGDVATALEMVAREKFDLLLSDLGLPDGSGVDLLRQLRSRGQTLPAIALSGYGQEQDLARTREAGFAAHIIKPVNIDQLLRAIAAASSEGARAE